MPGRVETPIDQLSGLPLLLAPNDQALRLLHGEESNFGRLADWNHAFHPAARVLAGGDGSDALRNARKQFVLRADHDTYHALWDGPTLPTTPAERFKIVTLCAAGYIPLQALDTSGRRPQLVNLTESQRERLRTSGEVRVASYSVVQSFLKNFVLKQPADHIRPAMVDKFLALDAETPTDAREKKFLAHLLLSLVIDRVEDLLDPPYSFGHAYNLLSPGLPTRPGDFVKSVIVRSPKNVRGMVAELTKKFTLVRDGPEVAARLGNLLLA